MKPSLKSKVNKRTGAVEVSLRSSDEFAFLGAAYMMTGKAYVALDRKQNKSLVLLRPKREKSLKALSAAFRKCFDNQVQRGKLARLNRNVRAESLRRALLLAENSRASFAPQPTLTLEQRREIEKILGEAESAKDPLGIATPWEELRKS